MWDVWKLFSIWIAENILQNHKFESTAQEAKACFCLQSRLESLFGFHIGSIPPKMIESSESMPIINIERKSTPKYSILPWSRFGTIFQSKDDHKKKPLLYKKCYSLAPCTIIVVFRSSIILLSSFSFHTTRVPWDKLSRITHQWSLFFRRHHQLERIRAKNAKIQESAKIGANFVAKRNQIQREKKLACGHLPVNPVR